MPAQAALKWDNLADSGQWLRGIEPVRTRRSRLHSVTLLPGESTELLVPPHEMIRVVACNGNAIADSGLEVWTSNGTGLYRKQVSAISKDGRSIISAPDQAEISTARIQLPNEAPCSIAVAIFTSRRAEPQRLDYYQCSLNGEQCNVEIKNNIGTRKANYTDVSAGKLHTIGTKGPTRLRIETRLKFDKYTQTRETYWIRVNVDGELARILTFDSRPQTSNRVFVNDVESLVGLREFSYLDIESDVPNVTIETSHPLFMRVEAVGLNLCRPKSNQNFALPTTDNLEKGTSVWNTPEFDPAAAALSRSFLYDENQVANEPVDPMWDPYLNQQRIQQLARNNRVRRGGLRAYMWMRAIATLHYGDATYRDEITVPEMAAKLRGNYTFYRDLLPLNLQSDNTMKVVDFPLRKIRDPKETFTERVIGEQHVSDSLSGNTATVFKKSSEDSQVLRYRPAKDLGTSLLRVVVNQTELTHPCKLMVQYDDTNPIELQVQCNAALPPDRFVPSRFEAALSALAVIHQRYSNGTNGGPYSQFQTPRPTVRAASAEFLLPADVDEIKVWVESENKATAYVGLQTLDGRKYQLSERAHRYLRDQDRKSTAFDFQDFLSNELNNETYPFPAAS